MFKFPRRKLRMKVVIWLSAVLLSAIALGQATNGSITGVVTDTSGAVIPDAKITIANTDTGFTYAATSTATGNYTVTQLPTGSA